MSFSIEKPILIQKKSVSTNLYYSIHFTYISFLPFDSFNNILQSKLIPVTSFLPIYLNYS